MPGSRRKQTSQTDEVVEDSVQETPKVTNDPPVVENHDETDVEAALARNVQDGKGGEDVPPSDFESFATAEVYPVVTPLALLAEEVLKGQWGDYVGLRDRLNDNGHSATEVLTEVNERLVRGAPSAHRASVSEVVDQIEHGEWGDNPRVLESRLLAAGFKAVVVFEILKEVRRG